MDQYTWGFVLSVVFDFCAMIILLLAFCSLKQYRCNPSLSSKYNVFLPENSLPFKSLVLKIFNTTLEEIKTECGEEAHHYLYITKTLAILISVLCPLAEIILLPVYRLGDNYSGDLFVISLGNILDRPDLLAAPFLVFLVYVCGCYYVLKVLVDETLKSSLCSNINFSALRVMNLPKNMKTDSLKKEVCNTLNMSKENVYVVPDLSKAIEFEQLLKHAKEELMHYLDVEKFKGKREVIKLKYLSDEKVDAIEHWEKQVKIFEYKLENEYKESVNRNSGVCIIKTSLKSDELLGAVVGKFAGAHLSSVVVPNDVRWENIENDEQTARAYHVLSTLFFFFMFIILFTPTAFLNVIFSLLDSLGLAAALVGVLGVYLPDVLMLVYQLTIVPAAVAYLIKREKHYSKSGEIISAMRKFLLFFLFSMLFIPAIGLGVVNIITLALQSKSFDKWSEDIVERMYESIFWFMAVILTQTFIVNILDLARLGSVIEMKYKALRSVSERETFNSYIPEPFYYAYEYSMLLTCFTIVLLFSIAYPLILMFGAIYLWYFVHKYNIMCFFSKDYVKSHVSTVVVKAYAFCIVVFQWFTCFLFIMSEFVAYEVLGFFFLVGAGVSLPVFWVKYNRMRNKKIKEKAENLDVESYVHPMEESCEDFLRHS